MTDEYMPPIDWNKVNLDEFTIPNLLNSLSNYGQSGYSPLGSITNMKPILPTTAVPQNTFFPPRVGVDASGNLVEKAGMNFGLNAPSFQLGLSGLGTIGNLWGAFQGNKLAKESLNWQKTFGNTNLNNSIRAFNENLQNRAEALGARRGWDDQQTAEYIKKFEATR